MGTPERIDPTAASAAHDHGGGRRSAMPPRASGAIETHAWRDGRTVTIRARVRVYGRRYRIDFGTNHEGWSVERARVELDASSSWSSAAPGSRQAGTETRPPRRSRRSATAAAWRASAS